MPPPTSRGLASSDAPEIVKWYTRARRFPQLIGKTPDGGTIWGGPYTYTQLIGGVAFIVIGSKTTWLWGQFGQIGNALLLFGSAYGLVLLLGRLPLGTRNPLHVAAGILRAVSAPAHGHLGGGPIRIRRPHRTTSRLVIGTPPHPRPIATTSDPTWAPTVSRDDVAAVTPEPGQHRGPRRLRPRRTPTRPVAPRRLRPPVHDQPASPPAPALTGVQRLLASASSPTEDIR